MGKYKENRDKDVLRRRCKILSIYSLLFKLIKLRNLQKITFYFRFYFLAFTEFTFNVFIAYVRC